MSVRTITGSALLLAIALLAQGFLRILIPWHGLVQFLIGTIIGACTALATWKYGTWSGVIIAVVTPVMAFVQGTLSIPIFAPIVGIGSVAYVFVVRLLGLARVWRTAISAAIVKSVVLYALFWGLFQIMTEIPEALQKGILFSMGWPQLVTGSCGILLAGYIIKRASLGQEKGSAK